MEINRPIMFGACTSPFISGLYYLLVTSKLIERSFSSQHFREEKEIEKLLGLSCLLSPCFTTYAINLMWIHKSAVKKWERKSYLGEDGKCFCECKDKSSKIFNKKCVKNGGLTVYPISLN